MAKCNHFPISKKFLSVVVGLLVALIGFQPSLSNAAAVQGTVDPDLLVSKKRKSASRYGSGSQTKETQSPKRIAVIYLDGDFPNEAFADVPKEQKMIQRELQFTPSVLPIAIGTKVYFPNEDETYHNVFSYSKAKSFDLGRYNKDSESQSVEFTKPGEVKVFCEIHDHMRSTILVLDTPYFTTTDEQGQFTLENLPTGEFTLKCWLRSRKILEQRITITEGSTLTVDFTK